MGLLEFLELLLDSKCERRPDTTFFRPLLFVGRATTTFSMRRGSGSDISLGGE
jgi:hypothetical protein